MTINAENPKRVGTSLFASSQLMTIQDLSKQMSIPVSTIRSWMYKRKIPFIKFGIGKRSIVRFNPRLIDDWISSIQTETMMAERSVHEALPEVGVRVAKRNTIEDFDIFANSLRETN